MRLLGESCNPDNLSPLTLAFVGDGVYELFVREHLACIANRPAGELSSRKVKMVKASAQAEAFGKISSICRKKNFRFSKGAETPPPPTRQKTPPPQTIMRRRGLKLCSAGFIFRT